MSAGIDSPIPYTPVGGYVESSPYWQGVQEGRLLLQYCEEAQRFQHPPGPVSIYTGGRRLSWREVSGSGCIYAFTTLRAKGLGADGRCPYTLALVELDEGVRLLAHAPAPEAGWRIGDPVVLDWETLEDGRRYPMFVPLPLK